jgi:hypothetical protein
VGQHPSASASGLLGLDGFEVTAAEVTDDEWRLAVQTIAATVGVCGLRHPGPTACAPHGPGAGPAGRWPAERTAIRPRAVLTERARAEACRRVGKDAHAVAAVARDLVGQFLAQQPAQLDIHGGHDCRGCSTSVTARPRAPKASAISRPM